MAVAADVTADDAAQKIISASVNAFGPSIDILVNNAGFTCEAPCQGSLLVWDCLAS